MTRRSLILAGGGLKIAFQAGVLQVWLDEAGIEFDHADAVSAAVFNLAMWCQGMTGTRIADNWRTFKPLAGISVNWQVVTRLAYAESLLSARRLRKNTLPAWNLDWDKIRASRRDASFNVYNFSEQRHVVVPPAEMTEDMLIAAVSLPMWFPPVVIGGQTFVDAVHASPANVDHAIDLGADELWIIWTISEAGVWKNGFNAEFFQIFEECGNSRLRDTLARIEKSNRAIAAQQPAEFDRHIEVKLLKAEVPLNYLLNFSRRRFAAAVDLGVAEGRDWCRRQGLAAQEPSTL